MQQQQVEEVEGSNLPEVTAVQQQQVEEDCTGAGAASLVPDVGQSVGEKKSGEQKEIKIPRKQKLQEQREKLKQIQSEVIEIIEDKTGLAGNLYRCRKCGIEKKTMIRIVGHAEACISKKKKTARKRGKSKRLIVCNKCTFKCTSTMAMTAHRKESHPSEKKYQCSRQSCKVELSSVKSLKQHLIEHIRGRFWACSKCPKKFSQPGTRNRHARTHKDDTQGQETRNDGGSPEIWSSLLLPGMSVKCPKCMDPSSSMTMSNLTYHLQRLVTKYIIENVCCAK